MTLDQFMAFLFIGGIAAMIACPFIAAGLLIATRQAAGKARDCHVAEAEADRLRAKYEPSVRASSIPAGYLPSTATMDALAVQLGAPDHKALLAVMSKGGKTLFKVTCWYFDEARR